MEYDYRDWLKEEFARRRLKNRSYSLRSFSRDLGISPASLSQAISGKRHLSKSSILFLSEKLSLSPNFTKSMLLQATPRVKNIQKIEYFHVSEDLFHLISDWYYFAILNLSKIKNHQADPKWISERLGLTLGEAKNALTKLMRLQLIEIENSKIIRTTKPIFTTTNIPSAALRKHHKQNLTLAEYSIDRDSLEKRENCSVTMAIDVKKIPEAKKKMEKFKKSFAKFLEKGNQTEVYTFSMHLFPSTMRRS